MERLKALINNPDSPGGRVFALVIQALILLSLASFSVETLPNLSDRAYRTLQLIEIVTVLLFTIEYVLRIYAAPQKREFLFSFFGIVDLLAILPFYLALGFDLRSIRAFRFLRLFRIFKLGRYNRAIQHFHSAFVAAREELLMFLFATGILLYISAVGIYYFEHQAQPEAYQSILHSLWWAVATLTTVGYGDVYPITAGGRVFTFVVLMLGLGVVAVPSGIIASALTETRGEKRKMK